MRASGHVKAKPLAEKAIVVRAIADSFAKLNPRTMMKNPVMFVVEVGAVLTTVELVRDTLNHTGTFGFGVQITVWLWFTVLFANFAEAMAEGRGKAQADALRKSRRDITARKLDRAPMNGKFDPSSAKLVPVTSADLRKGHLVLVEAGEFIPSDGEIVVGIASVDESAITGESAPVIREAGGDRSAVTGGTRVLSDWLGGKITADPREPLPDRMIA